MSSVPKLDAAGWQLYPCFPLVLTWPASDLGVLPRLLLDCQCCARGSAWPGGTERRPWLRSVKSGCSRDPPGVCGRLRLLMCSREWGLCTLKGDWAGMARASKVGVTMLSLAAAGASWPPAACRQHCSPCVRVLGIETCSERLWEGMKRGGLQCTAAHTCRSCLPCAEPGRLHCGCPCWQGCTTASCICSKCCRTNLPVCQAQGLESVVQVMHGAVHTITFRVKCSPAVSGLSAADAMITHPGQAVSVGGTGHTETCMAGRVVVQQPFSISI